MASLKHSAKAQADMGSVKVIGTAVKGTGTCHFFFQLSGSDFRIKCRSGVERTK